MEVSDVRRRLRAAIDKARQQAAERRARTDAASREYDEFLTQKAAPLFHQLASALAAEGHHFKVFTPAGSVRLASERRPDEFIELALDDTSDPPQVIGRSSQGRGRRTIAIERPVRDRAAIAELTEDDVLSFVLEQILPMVER
jgi:hypothetical protein